MLTSIEAQERVVLERLKELRDTHKTLTALKGRLSANSQDGEAHNNSSAAGFAFGVGIAEGTEILLREKGKLDTREIADLLKARGVRTKSQNFIPTVYATLRESPRFVRLQGERKWDLAANAPSEPPKRKRAAKKKKGAK